MEQQNPLHSIELPATLDLDNLEKRGVLSSPEIGNSQPASLASAQAQVSQLADPVVPSTNTQATPTMLVNDDSATVSNNVELIEKAWILKAKDIIEKTRDNPRAQSIGLGKVKAEYIKTHFNKDIKVNEQ